MKKNLWIAAIIMVFLNGFQNYKNDIRLKKSESYIYETAKKKIKNHQYKQAIKLFEMLNKNFPFSNNSYNSKLNIIYSYYKLKNFQLAMIKMNHFIKFNQISNVDYILYLRGLIEKSLTNNNNFFQNLLKFKKNNVNSKYFFAAFKDFYQLYKDYPYSVYTKKIKKTLLSMKETLAEEELDIMKYYYKKKAYLAVINRGKQLFLKYPETQAMKNSIKYIQKSYKNLK